MKRSFFGGPQRRDHSIWGPYWRPPISRSYHEYTKYAHAKNILGVKVYSRIQGSRAYSTGARDEDLGLRALGLGLFLDL